MRRKGEWKKGRGEGVRGKNDIILWVGYAMKRIMGTLPQSQAHIMSQGKGT